MTLTDFEAMARRLRPAIVARSLSMTSDADLADDIAQDTLLRLWQLRDRLDTYRSVDALARVIARNLAVDALRSRGATVSIDALSVDVPDSEGADAQLLDTEVRAEADTILASLAPAQQAVMRMRHTEGMEMDEIARALGTTPANVRVMLCRARARVRELFSEASAKK